MRTMCGVICSVETTVATRGGGSRGGRASAMAVGYSARWVDVGERAAQALERLVDDGAHATLDGACAEPLEHRGVQGPRAQADRGDDHAGQDGGPRIGR